MSGKPSPHGIAEVRVLLQEAVRLRTENARLTTEIFERQQALNANRQRATDIQRELPELLRRMDLSSDGNYGWEGRLLWAMTELTAQLNAAPTGDST